MVFFISPTVEDTEVKMLVKIKTSVFQILVKMEDTVVYRKFQVSLKKVVRPVHTDTVVAMILFQVSVRNVLSADK